MLYIYILYILFADFGILVPFLEASGGDQPKSDAFGTCRVAEGHLYTLLILWTGCIGKRFLTYKRI